MSEDFRFKQNEIDNIISRFGNNFYEKVLNDMEVYAEKWTLTSLQLIPSYSANLVFTCRSAKFGDAVLKIGNPSAKETFTECSTLLQYDGGRFCKVWEADPEKGVMLVERVQPGIPLRMESSLDNRLSVFCSLYKGLHVPPAKPGNYPTYTGWVDRITEYMKGRQDCAPLYSYMRKAKDACVSVSARYSQQMLLHGDFHHDNILLGMSGEYIIIDPKGVIGDPVFDVPRFMLNEFGDEFSPELTKKMNEIIRKLEQSLGIPNDILRQLLFVETTMGVCWQVEDGAAAADFPRLVEQVAFAESLMNT
jgi:streptomycin 6-kinase